MMKVMLIAEDVVTTSYAPVENLLKPIGFGSFNDDPNQTPGTGF